MPNENAKGMLIRLGRFVADSDEKFLLRHERTTIGRAPHCGVRINHPTVSRSHAEVTWEDGKPVLRHLSLVNSTLVNGTPIGDDESVVLQTGDIIQLANDISLRLELHASDDDDTMASLHEHRRLYAILFADAFSYARLIAEDDVATMHQMERCLAIVRQEAEQVRGRVVNVSGDGILVLFLSAASAVTCAIAIQRAIALMNRGLNANRQIEFRIGINSGDILMTQGGSIYGDAVNVAARVQAIASTGGILVTGVIYDQLHGNEDFRFEDNATQELKNISREIRTYRVCFDDQ